MKKDIHPTYKSITVTCNCGSKFSTGSVLEEIRIEVCDKCHPLYTGNMKFVDTKGRVERFQERQKRAREVQRVRKERQSAKQAEKVRRDNAPKTLREMLLGA